MSQVLEFSLPANLSAKEPPERRGWRRDGVRLMVIARQTGAVIHSQFDRLSDFLTPGDLLVFNSSRTIPASLIGRIGTDDVKLEMRLAEHLPNGSWLALLLCRSGDGDQACLRPGITIRFAQGLSAQVGARDPVIPRLWNVRLSSRGTELLDLLYRVGRPIRYEYVSAPWNLEYYQNVYAKEPGSSEMASAGRAFTWKTLIGLRRQGIRFADVTLHTGLSSYMDEASDREHPVSEEEYFIGEESAATIRAAQKEGGRVIAIGTTVVRALESAAEADSVRPGHRYTRLKVNAGYRLQVVQGLLTGLHETAASHLDLLRAFVSSEIVGKAYQEALHRRYLWHEFGDLNLIL
jgi:S-adenosylmethionine:tRNA ribosyltransferase-isomerase